jgi:hypothetical protein
MNNARVDWRAFGVLVAFVFMLAFPGLVRAQASASINGTVTDSSGAVVQHASITAVNQATGGIRNAETTDTGTYSIVSVIPGSYEVTVEKAGLKTIKFAGLVLTVDQVLTLDVKLEVSGTSATVVVEAGQIAPINTSDAQVSTVVDEKQIQDLPLILRDPYQLVLLTPGATQTNTGLGGFSINGAREQQNNFLLDGTNNNDPGVPGSGFATLNPDDTEEFRVITNNYLPEFGRNSGSIIDIVTRSGTNEIHGDAYYFGRWDALGARDWFNPPDTGPKNPYIRNIAGGSFGGPIKKNKVFFFFNYEGDRFITSTQAQATVPAAGFSTGKFTSVDGTTGAATNIDVSTPGAANNAFGLVLDPQVQKLLSFYPAGNGGPVLQGVSDNLFFPNADRVSNNNYLGKVDFNISSTNVLSVRYLANSGTDNGASSNQLPGLGGAAFTGLSQSLNGHLSTQLRSNLLNDLFATANRSNQAFTCVGASTIDSLSLAGLDPFGRGRDFDLPAFTGIACGALGDSNGQTRPFGTYNIGDNITWTKGRHTWKFGFEFADNYTNDFDNFSTRSLPSFAIFSNTGTSALKGIAPGALTPTVQDALWGLLGGTFQESQTQNFSSTGAAVPGDERGFRERDLYGFFQDQFKLASNFTLSYGLRYEWDGVPWVVNDQLTSATPAALAGPGPIVFDTVTRGGANPLYVNDVKGFEPRIGFAWDPFKTGKTSVRAGYGVFRDREFFNLTGDTRNNPPFSLPFVNPAFQNLGPGAADQISNIPIPATQPAPGFSLPDLSFAFPATIEPNFHVPYVQQWNLGIQRELGHNFTLEVNYVGNKANRLLRVVDGNAPIPALVAQLRAFCQNPTNAFGCVDSPTQTTVQGSNLYVGAEEGILPFDAVNNNAAFHSNQVASIANSKYNGLQTTLTHQFAHNVSFQANYTWAHAIDDASDAFRPQAGNTVFPADTNDLRPEKGNSSFDVRHRVILNFRAELPFGRGKDHLNNGLVGKALEGWSWSGILLAQTGFPFDIFAPGDDSNATGATQRADFDPHGTPAPPPTNPSGPMTGPNPGLFSFPLFGGPGNLTRNQFYGPGFTNLDMVIAKQTHITERISLEFRTEVYNIFNHPNFGQPDNFLGDSTFGQSLSQVGRNDSTTGARQMQFGLKLHF